MVELGVVGLEKDNKDSIQVFEVELACSCEVDYTALPRERRRHSLNTTRLSSIYNAGTG